MAQENKTHKGYYRITKVDPETIEKNRNNTMTEIGIQMANGYAMWQKAFDPAKEPGYQLPYDVIRGKYFEGYNMLEILAKRDMDGKIGTSAYITFDDLQKSSYRVKKGSTSIPIEHYTKYNMYYVKDEKGWQFYKKPSKNWIAYKKAVFSVNDLNGKYKFEAPALKIDGITFTKALVEESGVKVVTEKGLQNAYYAPRRDEIHIADISEYKTKEAYYGDLLRQTARSLTKPGRVTEKGSEGFAVNRADVRFLKDKFRVELAAMQLSVFTKLPYKPTMTKSDNEKISALCLKYPNYLVFMANQSAQLVRGAFGLYQNHKRALEEEETLAGFMNRAVKEGRLSYQQMKEEALKKNFKELDGMAHIKKVHLINEARNIAYEKTKDQNLGR